MALFEFATLIGGLCTSAANKLIPVRDCWPVAWWGLSWHDSKLFWHCSLVQVSGELISCNCGHIMWGRNTAVKTVNPCTQCMLICKPFSGSLRAEEAQFYSLYLFNAVKTPGHTHSSGIRGIWGFGVHRFNWLFQQLHPEPQGQAQLLQADSI